MSLPKGLSQIFHPSASDLVKQADIRVLTKSAILDTLRFKHPELFSLILNPEDQEVRYLKMAYMIDVTNEGILEVLLRPHISLIWTSRTGIDVISNMGNIIKDVMGKLNDSYPNRTDMSIKPSINYESLIWGSDIYDGIPQFHTAMRFLRNII